MIEQISNNHISIDILIERGDVSALEETVNCSSDLKENDVV